MPLKVIGAGLGRTGTLSLKTALETLGFGPCHHMVEVLGDMAGQGPFWSRAGDGLVTDWEEGLGAFGSSVDWPSAHFYAELAAFYPEAKVILSTRDPERWYESMSETILRSIGQMSVQAMPPGHPMRFGRTIIAEGTFGDDFSKANVIAAFERHNAAVRRRIPSERLLEFEARQGWEPLCAFLAVPVPAEPFPRVNDREAFARNAEKMQALREESASPGT
jgi:hypothetical protein